MNNIATVRPPARLVTVRPPALIKVQTVIPPSDALPPVIKIERFGFVAYIDTTSKPFIYLMNDFEHDNAEMDPIMFERFARFIAEASKVLANVHRYVSVYRMLSRLSDNSGTSKVEREHLLKQRDFLAKELRDYVYRELAGE